MQDLAPSEILGWIAALLTLAAMAMRTMMPLRVFATIASALFLAGALIAENTVLAALAAGILGANLYRLIQLRRTNSSVKGARNGEFSLEWISDVMRPVKFSEGEVIFRKGDPPHYIYYLQSGTVRLQEIDVTLGPGEIFGEIAFFTEAGERTLTATCEAPAEIMVIRETDFVNLYNQNPAFGLYMLRLVATRLLDGIGAHPDAYRRISALERKRREL